MKYDGSTALILGAGSSGEAAAALIIARGGSAAVLDASWKPERRQAIEALGARCLETFPEEAFTLCVTSPSIPIGHPWLAQCAARKIPVISELQLGADYWTGRALAITGSKGKSSLVKLCADTLTRAGRTACTAGNFGTPLSARVLEYAGSRDAWAIVEVSTFQMEHTAAFSPEAAVILNLQADHLDRHANMTEYGDLKRKLFSALKPGALALIPEGFDAKTAFPLHTFGTGPAADWRYAPGTVEGAGKRFSIAGTPFDNPILGLAAAAGCALLTAAGLTPAEIETGFACYEPLAHRMQRILDCGGVVYIDDSKATSLAATAAALKMCAPRHIRLIAGGILKEADATFIKSDLAKHVKKVYLIGDCAQRLLEAWSDAAPCVLCGDMATAVDQASADARPGEAVLLSPGTASFDQYPGYAARGNDFQTRLQRKCVGKP